MRPRRDEEGADELDDQLGLEIPFGRRRGEVKRVPKCCSGKERNFGKKQPKDCGFARDVHYNECVDEYVQLIA